MGGFVVTECYEHFRQTGDLDVIGMGVAPNRMSAKLNQLAGPGTDLAKKHKVYLDIVGVAIVPYEYESRLQDLYSDAFEWLHLKVMDPYDIALSKLSRNIDRDHEDVMHLARAIPFDLELFETRYREELYPYLFGDKKEKDDWFSAWLEDIRDERGGNRQEWT